MTARTVASVVQDYHANGFPGAGVAYARTGSKLHLVVDITGGGRTAQCGVRAVRAGHVPAPRATYLDGTPCQSCFGYAVLR